MGPRDGIRTDLQMYSLFLFSFQNHLDVGNSSKTMGEHIKRHRGHVACLSSPIRWTHYIETISPIRNWPVNSPLCWSLRSNSVIFGSEKYPRIDWCHNIFIFIFCCLLFCIHSTSPFQHFSQHFVFLLFGRIVVCVFQFALVIADQRFQLCVWTHSLRSPTLHIPSHIPSSHVGTHNTMKCDRYNFWKRSLTFHCLRIVQSTVNVIYWIHLIICHPPSLTTCLLHLSTIRETDLQFWISRSEFIVP